MRNGPAIQEGNRSEPIENRREGADSEIETRGRRPGGEERILLVDDEALILEIHTGVLESLGYKVVPKSSPGEALAAFGRDPSGFDLIFTDEKMEEMDGLCLIRNIRKLRPDIPVILCSGFTSDFDREKVRKMGISDFVKKPVRMRQVAESIREALDKGIPVQG